MVMIYKNSKNMNDKKKMLKQKGSSLLLSKHDIALNNNKTDISVLKIFKGIYFKDILYILYILNLKLKN